MMFVKNERELLQMMRKYDDKLTKRLWWSRETQAKVDGMRDAHSAVKRRDRDKPYDARWDTYINRDKIAEDLGITSDQAYRLNLNYTVPRSLSTSIKRRLSAGYRPRDWSAFQGAGTRQNSIRALNRAQTATDMRAEGKSIVEIAEYLRLSCRTIYRYLSRKLHASNVYGTIEDLVESVSMGHLLLNNQKILGRLQSAFQWPVTPVEKWAVLHEIRRLLYRKSNDPPLDSDQ